MTEPDKGQKAKVIRSHKKHTSDAQRLKTLAEKKKAIEARMHALKTRVAQKQRKEETRRKILLGAWILHEMDHPQTGDRLKTWARKQLPGFVKERDRHLFDDLKINW